MLTALIGAESLIFAALSISVALSGDSELGADWTVPPTILAFAVVAVLAAIATGAGFAWADLFGACHWPTSLGGQIPALALAVAIAAPPVISLVVAINMARA